MAAKKKTAAGAPGLPFLGVAGKCAVTGRDTKGQPVLEVKVGTKKGEILLSEVKTALMSARRAEG